MKNTSKTLINKAFGDFFFLFLIFGFSEISAIFRTFSDKMQVRMQAKNNYDKSLPVAMILYHYFIYIFE